MNHELIQALYRLKKDSRLPQERKLRQHGTTSVLRHSIQVAAVSLRLARALHLRVDRKALIRGALLHDYFLYDWHLPSGARPPMTHGFTHPKTALNNARADFSLSPREENIIARHMFPLTPVPPACREAWLVCLADKYCALQETFFSRSRHSAFGRSGPRK